LCLANGQGHVFFTESRYYVNISSVTSRDHVTDLYVYAAPSVGHRYDDVIICRLANVYHNDKESSDEAWPFTLSSPDHDNNNYYYYDNTVSLYVKPRDITVESRDHGKSQHRVAVRETT